MTARRLAKSVVLCCALAAAQCGNDDGQSGDIGASSEGRGGGATAEGGSNAASRERNALGGSPQSQNGDARDDTGRPSGSEATGGAATFGNGGGGVATGGGANEGAAMAGKSLTAGMSGAATTGPSTAASTSGANAGGVGSISAASAGAATPEGASGRDYAGIWSGLTTQNEVIEFVIDGVGLMEFEYDWVLPLCSSTTKITLAAPALLSDASVKFKFNAPAGMSTAITIDFVSESVATGELTFALRAPGGPSPVPVCTGTQTVEFTATKR